METAEFSLFLVKNSLIDKADDRFKAIMKWQDIDLFRQPLGFLFPPDAHDRLDRLLGSEDLLLEGVMFPRVPLRVKTGGYINFDMRMKRLDAGDRRLDFYRIGRAVAQPDVAAPPTDMYSFFNFVESLLNSPFEDDVGLTMVSVDALRPDSGLSDADRSAARGEIEQGLRGRAVGGTIGILDESSYGLLVTGGFDEKAYEQELQTVAVRLNLTPESLSPKSANVALDDRSLPSAQLQQALGHSRSVFLGEIEASGDTARLSGVVDGIQHNRKLIETALKKFQYRTSSREIYETVQHVGLALLQQGKINLEGEIRQPDEILVMTDHPDLSLAHDIAQLDDLIRLRKKRRPDEQKKPDIYEVCRSTLIQDSFFDQLAALLARYHETPASVGFRVKGLPPVKRGGVHWQAVNRLAELGHPLWIDRFGDAVTAPEALGCVQGGFVEMPAPLMRQLAGHFDGKELMEKLVKAWRSLNVTVITCDLPDHNMQVIAQEMGIRATVEDAP